MAKRTPKTHRYTIKKNTRGSSNEISFSVLDAAKDRLDPGKVEKPSVKNGQGKVTLFTLDNRKKPSSTPKKDHLIIISSNKDKPSRPSIKNQSASLPDSSRTVPLIAKVLGIAAAVVALVLVGIFAAQTLSQNASYQNSLKDSMRASIAAIDEADQDLMALDSTILTVTDNAYFEKLILQESDVTSESLTQAYENVSDDIPEVRTRLSDAITSLENLSTTLSDNSDKEAAHQAIDAAQSRLNMLESATKIVELAISATSAYEHAQTGWNQLIEADVTTRKATAALSDMTKAHAKQSMESSREAIEQFEEAQSSMSAAAQDYRYVDFSSYQDYLSKRIQAQNEALAACQAYLDRDKTELTNRNKDYNSLEKKAAKIAKGFGDGPALAVAASYEEEVKPDKESYEAERARAARSDTYLRDYLES